MRTLPYLHGADKPLQGLADGHEGEHVEGQVQDPHVEDRGRQHPPHCRRWDCTSVRCGCWSLTMHAECAKEGNMHVAQSRQLSACSSCGLPAELLCVRRVSALLRHGA